VTELKNLIRIDRMRVGTVLESSVIRVLYQKRRMSATTVVSIESENYGREYSPLRTPYACSSGRRESLLEADSLGTVN
jgi:hypothetical protein